MTQAPQGTWFFMCLHRTGSAVRRHPMGQSCAGMWARAECLPRAMTFTPRGLRTSSATGSCSIFSFGAELAIPSVGESTAFGRREIPQRSCDENSFESLSPSRAVSKQAEVLLSSRTKMQRISSTLSTLYHCQPHWQRTVSDRWNLRKTALHSAHDLVHINASCW